MTDYLGNRKIALQINKRTMKGLEVSRMLANVARLQKAFSEVSSPRPHRSFSSSLTLVSLFRVNLSHTFLTLYSSILFHLRLRTRQ